MTVVICPGIHNPELTKSFIAQLEAAMVASHRSVSPNNFLIVPAQAPAYSPAHILQFLQQRCDRRSPLVLICFSAGVVGGAGAAWAWQQSGGTITALIALDGWGVPLYGFPIHRVSHDYFTHWSSQLLGSGVDSFYADPAVEHLDLWRSPQTVRGWWVQHNQRQATTAATFLSLLLARYDQSS